MNRQASGVYNDIEDFDAPEPSDTLEHFAMHAYGVLELSDVDVQEQLHTLGRDTFKSGPLPIMIVEVGQEPLTSYERTIQVVTTRDIGKAVIQTSSIQVPAAILCHSAPKIINILMDVRKSALFTIRTEPAICLFFLHYQFQQYWKQEMPAPDTVENVIVFIELAESLGLVPNPAQWCAIRLLKRVTKGDRSGLEGLNDTAIHRARHLPFGRIYALALERVRVMLAATGTTEDGDCDMEDACDTEDAWTDIEE